MFSQSVVLQKSSRKTKICGPGETAEASDHSQTENKILFGLYTVYIMFLTVCTNQSELSD